MSVKAKLSYFALGIVVAIGLVFTGALISQTTTSEWTEFEQFEALKCKELMIVSDNDEPVAAISSTEDGGLLMIMDKNGTMRAAIGIRDNNSVTFQALNQSGGQSAILASNDGGNGQLVLYDRNEQKRHILASSGDSSFYTLHNALGGNDSPSISLLTDPHKNTFLYVRQGDKFDFLKPK